MSTAGKSGKIHFFHFYQIAFVLVFLLVLFLFSEFAAPLQQFCCLYTILLPERPILVYLFVVWFLPLCDCCNFRCQMCCCVLLPACQLYQPLDSDQCPCVCLCVCLRVCMCGGEPSSGCTCRLYR